MNYWRFLILFFLNFFVSNCWALDLVWPSNCKLWQECFVFQNSTGYFLSPNFADITSHSLIANEAANTGSLLPLAGEGGHRADEGIFVYELSKTKEFDKGLDISLATFDKMKENFEVLAAAAGKVKRVRDSELDNTNASADVAASSGKECGNGVIIEHAQGWETQYCHLQQNSIVVHAGQKVTAGQVLGKLGASGQTFFPKLYFLVRYNGETVDPFSQNLWADKNIIYRDIGLIDIGMSDKPPSLVELIDSPHYKKEFTRGDPAMIAWVRVFNIKAGDQQKFVFYSPDGNVYRRPIVETIKTNHSEWIASAGYPLRAKNIPMAYDGEWRVVYSIKREQKEWQEVGEIRFILQKQSHN